MINELKTVKNMAVCLSGQIKTGHPDSTEADWQISSKMWKYNIEKMREQNINLDVYVSTWNDSKITDKLFDFCKSYEIVNYPEYPTRLEYYSNIMYRCSILRNKYEIKENLKYDLVINTRPDTFVIFDDNLMDDLIVQSHTIYANKDCAITFGNNDIIIRNKKGRGTKYPYFFVNDVFFYGSSLTMDIYSQTIYNFFKHDNDFNALAEFHSLNVLIIRKLNLAIGTIDKGFLGATNVIRDYLRNSEDATKFNNEWLEKIK